MTQDPYTRRTTDGLQDQLDDQMRRATDLKEKDLLIIMNKIAANLEANTALTKALADDFKAHTIAFKKHEEQEMALINQGKGGWKATLFFFGVLQAVFGYLGYGMLEDIKSLKADVIAVRRDVDVHKEHHEQEERFQREKGNMVPLVK